MGATVARDRRDGSCGTPRRSPTVRIALLVPDRPCLVDRLDRNRLRNDQVPERDRDGGGVDPRLLPGAPPRLADGGGNRRTRDDVHLGALLRRLPASRGAGVPDVRAVRPGRLPLPRRRRAPVDDRDDRACARGCRGAQGARLRGCGVGDRGGVALVLRSARAADPLGLVAWRQGRRGAARGRRLRRGQPRRQPARDRVDDRQSELPAPHVDARARGRLGAHDRSRHPAGDRGARRSLAPRAAQGPALARLRRVLRRVDPDLRPLHRREGGVPLDGLRDPRRGTQPDLSRPADPDRGDHLLLGAPPVRSRARCVDGVRRLARARLRLSARLPVLRGARLRHRHDGEPLVLVGPADDPDRARSRVRRRRCGRRAAVRRSHEAGSRAG